MNLEQLIRERLKKAFKLMAESKLDGLLVSSWPNVTYLSGFTGMESWLFISPKGLYFITDSRYSEQAENETNGFKVLLRDKKGLGEIVLGLANQLKLKTIGFEAGIVTHSFYLGLAKTLGSDRLKVTSNLIEKLRLLKDNCEIDLIKKSADIAVKGYHYVKQIVQPWMKEREVQGRLEHYTKTLGSEKPAFDIIIASGARSSMAHSKTDETVIKKNQVVLVDMGVVYNGYHSDLTRPVFLGKMPPLLKEIHGIVWEAQRAGIAKAGPGVAVKDVDAACRDLIRKAGYEKQFGHGTGHGVGLEIHESPSVSGRSATILKPGMVITVEPGIYLPGKFGIRIEDMVLITEKGKEVLTDGLDK